MDEDELLEEFGFAKDVKRRGPGRGIICNLLGKKNGLFVCIHRHPQNKSSGEARWVMECTQCEHQRVMSGHSIRTTKMLCKNCEVNIQPRIAAKKDWRLQLDALKSRMLDAIKNSDLEQIEIVGRKISRAAFRVKNLEMADKC